MIRPRSLFLPFALLTLSACAGQAEFNRTEIQDVIRQTVHLTPPPTAPGTAEQSRPAVTAPFRLGLFFTRQEFPTRQTIRPIEWLSRDKEAVLLALAPLQDQHILRESLIIADSAAPHLSLAEIRKAAARYGADMIMIVTGAGAVDRSNNGYALLYPTILGAYLAPGTVSEALVLIEGSLWDVRSGLAYDTVSAEGQSRLVGPAMILEDRTALIQGKDLALNTLSTRLIERLRRLMPSRPQETHSQP